MQLLAYSSVFMNPDQLAELKNNEVVRKRLGKFTAHSCFRNSALENFHDRAQRDVPNSKNRRSSISSALGILPEKRLCEASWGNSKPARLEFPHA